MTISEVSPSANVVLDGSGNGQCAIYPPSGTKWALRLATLSIPNAIKHPQAFLYRGSPSGPLQLVDSTITGDAASSAKVGGAVYYPGQWLWAVWKGGDPGAIATLQAFGQQGARSDPLADSPLGEGFPNQIALSLQVGTSAIGQITIDTSLPALLAAGYAAMGTIANANIRMSPGDASYHFELVGIRSSGPGSFYASGWVPVGATTTADIRQEWFSFYDTTSDIEEINLLDPGHDSRLVIEANFVRIGDSLAGNVEIDGTLSVFDPVTIGGSAGQNMLIVGRVADTQARFGADADGTIFTGPGGVTAPDTSLRRAAAGVWASDPVKARVSGVTETWHGFSFLNGFSNRGAGFVAGSYRLVPSPANEVEIKGQIVSGATVASGTIITNLPAGYRPISEQIIVCQNNNSFATILLTVETNGDVKLFGTWANGNVIMINGFVALDL